MLQNLRNTLSRIKNEIRVYRLVLQDPRTPKTAKLLLWIALGYLALPFDMIPDFIPGIGHLDDIIIVPALVVVAIRLIPSEVVQDARAKARN